MTNHVHRAVLSGAALVVLASVGCGQNTDYLDISPRLKATVIDEKTRAPLESVDVVMWLAEDPSIRQEGVSDDKGRVELPPLRGTEPRMYVVFPPTVARFKKTGYLSREIHSQSAWQFFDQKEPVELTPER